MPGRTSLSNLVPRSGIGVVDEMTIVCRVLTPFVSFPFAWMVTVGPAGAVKFLEGEEADGTIEGADSGRIVGSVVSDGMAVVVGGCDVDGGGKGGASVAFVFTLLSCNAVVAFCRPS
jgi:hypothetical protein